MIPSEMWLLTTRVLLRRGEVLHRVSRLGRLVIMVANLLLQVIRDRLGLVALLLIRLVHAEAILVCF